MGWDWMDKIEQIGQLETRRKSKNQGAEGWTVGICMIYSPVLYFYKYSCLS